jgi:hypothetical protein
MTARTSHAARRTADADPLGRPLLTSTDFTPAAVRG